MKLLTVTVPCYNSAAYMKKCVDSILSGGERIEIIIIDDGSKDDTGKIADEYALKYPTIVKVIHQENGGHGEGINQGIKYASGQYFKVIDSDDWAGEDELKAMLNRLEELEQSGGVDMLITNYVYEHDNILKNRTIRYFNVFHSDKVVSWDDTWPFLETQYLTIHTTTYRTNLLRECGLVLPKHLFYEDNLYVYSPLPYVKKMCYMDINLYHYYIGREDQSVAEKVIVKRYEQQIKASTLLFCSNDINEVKKTNPKLAKYMYHECTMLLMIASIFARLNKTDEAEEKVNQMWKDVIAHDSIIGTKIRYHSIAKYMNIPGKAGRSLSIFIYRFAHGVMKFN